MKMPKTSAELFKQAFQHYQDQKFEEAFILLTDSIGEFSDWSWKIQFWLICMASKLNNVQLAVSIFNQAIQDGYWYSETQLRDDKDLEILLGLSEF